jgi:hypothetical protein
MLTDSQPAVATAADLSTAAQAPAFTFHQTPAVRFLPLLRLQDALLDQVRPCEVNVLQSARMKVAWITGADGVVLTHAQLDQSGGR